MKQALRIFLFIAACILATALVLGTGACSVLGIATEDYVEQRVVSVDEKVTEAAVEVAEPVDLVLPGYSRFVRGAYEGRAVAPPPPPESEFPWLEVVGIVGAAFGVSVPAAVGATNRMRDQRRRKLNEATSVAEAVRKGYYAPVPEPEPDAPAVQS